MTRINILTAAVFLLLSSAALAHEWADLKKYEYGGDLSPLLAIERQVETSMADKARQSAMAAKLLALLTDKDSTLPARQHAGLMLRICATEAEVPALAKMLGQGKPGEFARGALERIPAKTAGKALRESLARLKGPALIAVINSIANRHDREAVPTLIGLTGCDDAKVSASAAHALGRIGGPAATAHLKKLASDGKNAELAQAYLSCGIIAAAAGDKPAADEIFSRLSDKIFPSPVRRAALNGQLELSDDAGALLGKWLDGNDPAAYRVALDNIKNQSNEWLKKAMHGKPTQRAILFAIVLASRDDKAALPVLTEAVKQKDNATLRTLAISAITKVADRDSVSLLIGLLGEKPPLSLHAVKALTNMPGSLVDEPIIEAYEKTSGLHRATVNDVVVARRITAIVPLLLKLAKVEDDSALRADVVYALRALGDDKTLSPLVEVILGVKDRKHRDSLETTYLEIAKRHNNTVRPILEAMRKKDATVGLLPVLGRVGGPEALQKVQQAVAGKDGDLKAAGIRAICNWPDASVAEQLAKLASEDKDKSVRVHALRAYIRVVSLESKRPTEKTLDMLKQAFKIAQRPDEKVLAVNRAAAVRDVKTLDWLVSLLDNQGVAQEACRSIVELSHHRYLRNPNRKKFNAALKKVIAISKDPKTLSRANGYLQGV